MLSPGTGNSARCSRAVALVATVSLAVGGTFVVASPAVGAPAWANSPSPGPPTAVPARVAVVCPEEPRDEASRRATTQITA